MATKAPAVKSAPKTPKLDPELVKSLLKAGVHFGHRTERWHPKMAPYIHSARGGVHMSRSMSDSLRGRTDRSSRRDAIARSTRDHAMSRSAHW